MIRFRCATAPVGTTVFRAGEIRWLAALFRLSGMTLNGDAASGRALQEHSFVPLPSETQMKFVNAWGE